MYEFKNAPKDNRQYPTAESVRETFYDIHADAKKYPHPVP